MSSAPLERREGSAGANGKACPGGPARPGAPTPKGKPLPGFANCQPSGSGRKPVPTKRPVTDLVAELTRLTGGWPKRQGKQLFVPAEPGGKDPVRYLDRCGDLFAWLHATVDLQWPAVAGLVTKSEFFFALQAHAPVVEGVESQPHFPPIPGVYYPSPEPLPRPTGKLDRLLGMFCPATEVDARLIKAFFCTLFWGGPGGSRPVFVITTPDGAAGGGVGFGKSTLTEAGGWLAGGIVEVDPRLRMDQLKKRLLSPDARGRRLARIDNLKALGFESSELEALITAEEISGYRLYQGEGRLPNRLTWVITANGASLGRDLAQRAVVIVLERPGDDPGWKDRLSRFVVQYRAEILADIRAALAARPAAMRGPGFRFGAWQQGVLARMGAPSECLRVILGRQAAVDSDTDEADVVAAHFGARLREHGHAPDTAFVFIPAATAADWLADATKRYRPTNKASAHLKQLAIRGLTKSKKDEKPGWAWRGANATAKSMCRLREPAAARKPRSAGRGRS